MAALQSGDADRAYELSRSALHQAPDDPQTRFTYGLVLGSRQRFPEAIRMLDAVAEVMPQAKLPALGQTAE
ncbi:MAG: tetratricopeptide repeat protein, partial [Planctomycetota bacterium]